MTCDYFFFHFILLSSKVQKQHKLHSKAVREEFGLFSDSVYDIESVLLFVEKSCLSSLRSTSVVRLSRGVLIEVPGVNKVFSLRCVFREVSLQGGCPYRTRLTVQRSMHPGKCADVRTVAV